MRVIARKGMSAATMQEIAEEAGVAKGTIYLYFRDRDELVEKTFESAITQLIKRLDAAMTSDATFEARIRAIIAAKITFFNENREFLRLYMSLRMPEGTAQQQSRRRTKCDARYQEPLKRFSEELKRAMDRGEIREMDPERLALFLSEGTNAIVLDRVLADAPPPDEQDVDFMVSLIFEGMRKRS
jgi:AcrR family transcriptional regulator